MKKKYVITKKEAEVIFTGLNFYFEGRNGPVGNNDAGHTTYIGGKHITEIFAEELLRRGDFCASQCLMEFHTAMEQLLAKDYKLGLSNWNGLCVENVQTEIVDLKNGLESIMEVPKEIDYILREKDVDVVKSAEVLNSISPAKPSMMEQLSAWQRQQQEKGGRQ